MEYLKLIFIFDIGTYDETSNTLGITHLLEHIILTSLDCNKENIFINNGIIYNGFTSNTHILLIINCYFDKYKLIINKMYDIIYNPCFTTKIIDKAKISITQELNIKYNNISNDFNHYINNYYGVNNKFNISIILNNIKKFNKKQILYRYSQINSIKILFLSNNNNLIFNFVRNINIKYNNNFTHHFVNNDLLCVDNIFNSNVKNSIVQKHLKNIIILKNNTLSNKHKLSTIKICFQSKYIISDIDNIYIYYLDKLLVSTLSSYYTNILRNKYKLIYNIDFEVEYTPLYTNIIFTLQTYDTKKLINVFLKSTYNIYYFNFNILKKMLYTYIIYFKNIESKTNYYILNVIHNIKNIIPYEDHINSIKTYNFNSLLKKVLTNNIFIKEY